MRASEAFVDYQNYDHTFTAEEQDVAMHNELAATSLSYYFVIPPRQRYYSQV